MSNLNAYPTTLSSSRSAFFSSSCIRGSFYVLIKAIVHAVCDFLYLLAHGTPNTASRCFPSTGLNISTGSPAAASKDRAHRLRRVRSTGEHSASPLPRPTPKIESKKKKKTKTKKTPSRKRVFRCAPLPVCIRFLASSPQYQESRTHLLPPRNIHR
jgi:hypothetical protein